MRQHMAAMLTLFTIASLLAQTANGTPGQRGISSVNRGVQITGNHKACFSSLSLTSMRCRESLGARAICTSDSVSSRNGVFFEGGFRRQQRVLAGDIDRCGGENLMGRPSLRGAAVLRATASKSDELAAEKIEFNLRRARKFELDNLAVLSTEAFQPRGDWFDVVQRTKFLLISWDLQAQLYQRFTHWPDCIKSFKPPITESRYALLVAAKKSGIPIGVTELCVAPCPTPRDVVESMGYDWETAPYISNLAVEAKFRRQGIGQALVKMCEDLSTEWGHSVLFLHVEESNTSALDFYARLGFVEIKRDLAWYDRIGRQDLQQQEQKLLYKILESQSSPLNTSEASGEESSGSGYW